MPSYPMVPRAEPEDLDLTMLINVRIGTPRTTLRPIQAVTSILGPLPSVKFNPRTENLTILRRKVQQLLGPVQHTFKWPADQQIYHKKARSHQPPDFVLLTQEGIVQGDLRVRGKDSLERHLFVYLNRRDLSGPTGPTSPANYRVQGVIRSSPPRRALELGDVLSQPDSARTASTSRPPRRIHGLLARTQQEASLPSAPPTTMAPRQAERVHQLIPANRTRSSVDVVPEADSFAEIPIIFNGIQQSLRLHIPTLRQVLGLPNGRPVSPQNRNNEIQEELVDDQDSLDEELQDYD